MSWTPVVWCQEDHLQWFMGPETLVLRNFNIKFTGNIWTLDDSRLQLQFSRILRLTLYAYKAYINTHTYTKKRGGCVCLYISLTFFPILSNKFSSSPLSENRVRLLQEEVWWSHTKHWGICIRGFSNASFKASLLLTWIFDMKSCWFHVSRYPGTVWKWWEDRLEGGNEQVGKDLVIKAEDLDSKVIDRRRLLQLIVQTRALP